MPYLIAKSIYGAEPDGDRIASIVCAARRDFAGSSISVASVTRMLKQSGRGARELFALCKMICIGGRQEGKALLPRWRLRLERLPVGGQVRQLGLPPRPPPTGWGLLRLLLRSRGRPARGGGSVGYGDRHVVRGRQGPPCAARALGGPARPPRYETASRLLPPPRPHARFLCPSSPSFAPPPPQLAVRRPHAQCFARHRGPAGVIKGMWDRRCARLYRFWPHARPGQ